VHRKSEDVSKFQSQGRETSINQSLDGGGEGGKRAKTTFGLIVTFSGV